MSNIRKAFQTFESIGSTTSRTEKESLLKNNKDNEELKQLLQITYNPFIVFGIKKDPKATPLDGDATDDRLEYNFVHFLDVINKLSGRHLTGNKGIDALTKVLNDCTEIEAKWYLRVLQRDLKIGITDKTVNKVWKGLIPSFTCALANSYADKLPKRFVTDPKLDGYRCLAFNYADERGVELRSRNGHPISGYVGIESDIANYLPKGFMFDGEIMARDKSFSGVQKEAFKKSVDKDGVLNIFDAVQIEEFETGNFLYPYETRLNFLAQLDDILSDCRSLERVYPNVALTNTEADKAILFTIHTENVEKGYEGTMIKDLDAKYKKDKSNNILKMKDFYAIDLTIEGVYEGKPGTQFEGTMGGVKVMVSDTDIKEQCPVDDPKHTKKLKYIEGGTFEVGVGSGWNHEERDMYWNNPNLIIGKTLEISFQETTINEKGGHSLRFPTKVKIRDDK